METKWKSLLNLYNSFLFEKLAVMTNLPHKTIENHWCALFIFLTNLRKSTSQRGKHLRFIPQTRQKWSLFEALVPGHKKRIIYINVNRRKHNKGWSTPKGQLVYLGVFGVSNIFEYQQFIKINWSCSRQRCAL